MQVRDSSACVGGRMSVYPGPRDYVLGWSTSDHRAINTDGCRIMLSFATLIITETIWLQIESPSCTNMRNKFQRTSLGGSYLSYYRRRIARLVRCDHPAGNIQLWVVRGRTVRVVA